MKEMQKQRYRKNKALLNFGYGSARNGTWDHRASHTKLYCCLSSPGHVFLFSDAT